MKWFYLNACQRQFPQFSACAGKPWHLTLWCQTRNFPGKKREFWWLLIVLLFLLVLKNITSKHIFCTNKCQTKFTRRGNKIIMICTYCYLIFLRASRGESSFLKTPNRSFYKKKSFNLSPQSQKKASVQNEKAWKIKCSWKITWISSLNVTILVGLLIICSIGTIRRLESSSHLKR